MDEETRAGSIKKELREVDPKKVAQIAREHEISEDQAENLMRSTHSQEELDSAASAAGRWS